MMGWWDGFLLWGTGVTFDKECHGLGPDNLGDCLPGTFPCSLFQYLCKQQYVTGLCAFFHFFAQQNKTAFLVIVYKMFQFIVANYGDREVATR